MKAHVKGWLPDPILGRYRRVRAALTGAYAVTVDHLANRVTGKEWLPPLDQRRYVGAPQDFEIVGAQQDAFPYGTSEFRYVDAHVPEQACTYDESYLRGLIARAGLQLQHPPFYGGATGARDWLSGQDILILERASIRS